MKIDKSSPNCKRMKLLGLCMGNQSCKLILFDLFGYNKKAMRLLSFGYCYCTISMQHFPWIIVFSCDFWIQGLYLSDTASLSGIRSSTRQGWTHRETDETAQLWGLCQKAQQGWKIFLPFRLVRALIKEVRPCFGRVIFVGMEIEYQKGTLTMDQISILLQPAFLSDRLAGFHDSSKGLDVLRLPLERSRHTARQRTRS